MGGAYEAIIADRVLAVVRAPEIPDAAALCRALAAGGIRCVELTYTTPDLAGHLARATAAEGTYLGAGTVLTAAQATGANIVASHSDAAKAARTVWGGPCKHGKFIAGLLDTLSWRQRESL